VIRPPNAIRGLSNHPHKKSKMTDGRHIEKKSILISPQWFDRSLRNLARWRKLALSTLPIVKNSTFKKSKMSDRPILNIKNRDISVTIQPIATIFGR